MDKQTAFIEYEKAFESRKWVKTLPYLTFKPEWNVKIIPPTGGAVIRFLVAHKNNPSNTISVYFDGYNLLGCCKQPYWEMYPFEDDAARFSENETEELMQCIEKQLNKMLEDKQ